MAVGLGEAVPGHVYKPPRPGHRLGVHEMCDYEYYWGEGKTTEQGEPELESEGAPGVHEVGEGGSRYSGRKRQATPGHEQ